MRVCIRCGRPATHQLAFDPDITPIPICDDRQCFDNVRLALVVFDEKLRKALLAPPKKPKKPRLAIRDSRFG